MKKDFLDVLKSHPEYQVMLEIMNEQEYTVQREFLEAIKESVSGYVFPLSKDDDYNDLCPLESPIEKMLYLRLKQEVDYMDFLMEACIINPQSSIKIEGKYKYRADILICCLVDTGEGYKSFDIIVECDGHEFHNATKEQVAKDRKRDRELTNEGYTIFRFTGSEINKDASSCAKEVTKFIRKKREELL